MSLVNESQMYIHWQGQIHATTTSLIINNSETSGSKIRENRASWKEAKMILFTNMKIKQIFETKINK
jgi:hypothetical protein